MNDLENRYSEMIKRMTKTHCIYKHSHYKYVLIFFRYGNQVEYEFWTIWGLFRRLRSQFGDDFSLACIRKKDKLIIGREEIYKRLYNYTTP